MLQLENILQGMLNGRGNEQAQPCKISELPPVDSQIYPIHAGWGKYPSAAVTPPLPVSPPLLGTRPLTLSPDLATAT
ncbi:hypothetical protein J6590_027439 [Homalodisca vitripennis]|nr:hypothetical protein J6590_027439 [Homalodisca vitripennis]